MQVIENILHMKYIILILLLIIDNCSCSTEVSSATGRKKRFIVFNANDVVKFVAGTSYPVKLYNKQHSLNMVFNLQAQYTPPPRPLYWWSYFNASTFAIRQNSVHIVDYSREWIYQMIEYMLERYAGIKANGCLLRAICEVSQIPFHVAPQNSWSLYSEVLNAILIPKVYGGINEKYLKARTIGEAGANCTSSYCNCGIQLWSRFKRVAKIISDNK